ncbi:MAG: hypothetical protein WCF71_06725 [Verrucomicrobiia bacterium]
MKLLVVSAGIVLGQAILYGPSLIGEKILLPLDILAQPGVYMPPTPETAKIVPHNIVLSDLIAGLEPARQFAISEIHRGRFPLWAPYQYGGVPFVWPKYSLFLLWECLIKSPVILAWGQLFAALVAGMGMYFFCRRVLTVSFWPATVCAWCYPLTAFFVLWQGFFTGLAVCWLPWLFLSVDKTMRGINPRTAIGLSLVTFLVLTSGQMDIAGQVLLGSGFYATWCLWHAHPGQWFQRKFRTALAMLALGWGLGFLLAAPHLLPLVEYAKTGSRMIHRSAGAEERPPVGLTALPQVVLPDIYGTTENGSTFIAIEREPSLPESATAAYTGVLAALLVAPLAGFSRRHRAINAFWIFLAFFGLSWSLAVPGFVDLLRLPGLNMMSHNRLVFLTSFAILSLTAIGLENLLCGSVQRRWWFWLPAGLLAGLFAWCIYRSMILPEPIANQSNFNAFYSTHLRSIQITRDVNEIQAWFTRHYVIMAEFCALGFVGWLLLWLHKSARFLFPAFAILLVGDLLRFDYGRSPQCDPSLYYPKIPVFDQVAQSIPGRVASGLPASVTFMAGLNELKGDDAIDPARMVNLLRRVADPRSVIIPHAQLQYFIPLVKFSPPSGLRLPPVLDMLNVRYGVFRGVPPSSLRPAFQGDGYMVFVNSNALPRVFIPKSVQTMTNDEAELTALTSPQFNPANIAFVETPVELPADCRGTAQITSEMPAHITVEVRMQTPGLIVLADNWDQGWRACYNGKPVPVLRANYTIRGVMVPAGTGTLEFIYKPASLILGLWLAGLAVIVLAGWLIAIKIRMVKIEVPPLPGP